MASAAVCSFPGIIDHAAVYIHALGGLAVPLAGVLVIDYVFVQKQRIDVPSLAGGDGAYRYYYGYNLAAFASIALAAVYFYAAPERFMPGLTSCLLAACLHALLTRLSPVVSRMRRATR
jgi:cytosine/uracil/thiamine/allantoin permease